MLLTDEELKNEIDLLLLFAHENIRRVANGLPRLSGPEPYLRQEASLKEGADKKDSLATKTPSHPSTPTAIKNDGETNKPVKVSAAKSASNSQRARLSEFQPAVVYVKASHSLSPKPPLSSKVTVTVQTKPLASGTPAATPAAVTQPLITRTATTAPATSRTMPRAPLMSSSNHPSAPIRPASLPAARVIPPRMQKIVKEPPAIDPIVREALRMQKIVKEPPAIDPIVREALGWGAVVHERPVMAPYPPLPQNYVVFDPYRDHFGSKSNKTAR
ncbi:hypothetical protein HDU87_000730 [Geranomyces variabilis]|uniref:Uncharacterized protein n=1 Tax=Geranomyces variabilis TaxID=109894 RepID=A0AAD5TQE2_9FUNG|nr:hypothetical protein HDU87_000730 [Geranomyces variabilis]